MLFFFRSFKVLYSFFFKTVYFLVSWLACYFLPGFFLIVSVLLLSISFKSSPKSSSYMRFNKFNIYIFFFFLKRSSFSNLPSSFSYSYTLSFLVVFFQPNFFMSRTLRHGLTCEEWCSLRTVDHLRQKSEPVSFIFPIISFIISRKHSSSKRRKWIQNEENKFLVWISPTLFFIWEGYFF